MPRGVPSMVHSAALTFGAGATDVLTVDNDTLQGFDPFTYLTWVYPTTLTDTRRFFQTSTSANANRKMLRLSGTTGNVEVLVSRATTNTDFITSDTPLANVSRWYCVMLNFNSALSPTIRISVGTDVTPMVLRVCGVTAVDGTGTVNQEGAGGQYRIMNGVAGASLAIQGRCAVSAYFNRDLTLAEGIAWQFSALDEPYPAVMAGCRGLWFPGNEGAAKVLDYAGQHIDGTVTGATLARGLALPYRDPMVTDRRRYRTPDAAATYGYSVLGSPIFDGRICA